MYFAFIYEPVYLPVKPWNVLCASQPVPTLLCALQPVPILL